MREQLEPYIGNRLRVTWRDEGADHVLMQQTEGTDSYQAHEGVVEDVTRTTLVFVDGTTVPLSAIDLWNGVLSSRREGV